MTTDDHSTPTVGLDSPLRPETALQHDKLGRKGFAESAIASLRRISPDAGFVLSIEGAWGSGKTSTLAMLEQLLRFETHRPLIVHFNPWLVGERDALLRNFLAKLATAVKLADHAKDGKRVAKELKTYAKAFDIVKFIPGAEPWASIIKSVVETVGDATDSITEYKTPDIELQKGRVESALRKFPKPIIVFIDDIDRLFPVEVFEMVRIVKAVGDLPNVGYVLAWDPAYVSSALDSASVPQSETYLDKIVQVRMPLPALSLSARGALINDALSRLHPDALKTYFARDKDRLSALYFSGLRDLLEQPRDVTRVFNTVAVIEPALRGEVVFADIVGLAALCVKAPAVYELLRKHPQWFVGRLPRDFGLFDSSEEVLREGAAHRDAAYIECARPEAARKLVRRLFPQSAKTEDKFTIDRVSYIEGHLAAPSRLLVALQLSISLEDVSFVEARRYLSHPERRHDIASALTVQNCLEFMESLGDVAESLGGQGVADLGELCVAIARLADTAPFPERSHDRSGFFAQRAENVAVRAIGLLVKAVAADRGPDIAALIVEDEHSLTVAMELLVRSYLVDDKEAESPLICAPGDKIRLNRKLARNAIAAAQSGSLLRGCSPGFVLWNLASGIRSECRKIFAAIKAFDPSLDAFALELLSCSFDSTRGQTYSLPSDATTLEAYCSLDAFRKHARERLTDSSMSFPARAAWLSVVEGKKVYGVDGSPARN